jgi:hypothetical protein
VALGSVPAVLSAPTTFVRVALFLTQAGNSLSKPYGGASPRNCGTAGQCVQIAHAGDPVPLLAKRSMRSLRGVLTTHLGQAPNPHAYRVPLRPAAILPVTDLRTRLTVFHRSPYVTYRWAVSRRKISPSTELGTCSPNAASQKDHSEVANP